MKRSSIQTAVVVLGCFFTNTMQAYAETSSPTPPICDAMKTFGADHYLAVIGQKLLDNTSFMKYQELKPDDLAGIKEFKARLEARGIKLVVVPIPDSAPYYINSSNNPSPSTYDPKAVLSAEAKWIAAVQSTGLNVINTPTIADELASQQIPFFPNRDHHWTGKASNVVANSAANLIDSLHLGISQSLNATLSMTTDGFKGAYDKMIEDTCHVQVNSLESRDFYALNVESQVSLLDDTKPDIVVVADSFSDPPYSFVQSLSYDLKNLVQDEGVSGGGSQSSINGYLSRIDPENPPKVIVWVGRDLDLSRYATKELIATLDITMNRSSALFKTTVPFRLTSKIDASDDILIPVNISLVKGKRYRTEITIHGPKVDQMLFRAYSSSSFTEKYFVRVSQKTFPYWNTTFSYDISDQDTLKSITLGPRFVQYVPEDSSIDIKVVSY